MYELSVLPLRVLTWVVCVALVIIALPLVVYLRAHDALDASADSATI
jgi:hypothetical protein